MVCKIELGHDAFRDACRPPQRLLPSDYAHDRVAIYEGKSPYYDKHATPWMNEPLDQLANPECTELILLAPTGSGKTTMMEAALAYIVAEDPGPTLIVGQTNKTIEEWFETRLMHTFRNTTETKDLVPTGKHRHKSRKDAIIFPHMSLYSTGANISGTQARSMRRVICDEEWTYKKGIRRQAQARLHDRHNRQFISVSQGGTIGDDWHEAWTQTSQKERHYCCPKCMTEQTYSWGSVQYDEVQGDDVATSKTARIKCVNTDCDFIITEDAELRRRLSMNARYIQTTTGVDGSFGYRFSMLENWQVPLSRIVLERIKAMKEVSRGNLELLKSFIQKRLADFWNDQQEDERPSLMGGGYSIKDYANGEKWDDEYVRFMTIDRQLDHFWVVIRAWDIEGCSRLLYFGKVDTWDRLREIQAQYKVDNPKTQVDSGYQTYEVYGRCAEYGWLALRGSKFNEYTHKTRSGKTIKKAYSRYQKAIGSNHKETKVADWSNLVIKDLMHQIRNGKGVKWEIPDDIGNEYLHQIDAEVRRGEGKGAVWEKRRRDNHAVDCEAMQIVLASSLGLIGTPESETEE